MIRLAALLSLLAAGVAAQEIAVQSGEHPGFSRLSVAAGEGTGWRAARTADGYVLLVERDDDFAIGKVFEMIPRDRIAEVTAAPGRLDIRLACDCHLEAYPWQRGWLILDVADGAPDPASPFETPLAGDPPPPPAAARPVPLFAARPHDLPLPFAGPALPAVSAVPASPEPRDRAAAIERAMAEGIARGAAQGLLDLAVTDPRVGEGLPPVVPGDTPGLAIAAAEGRPGILTRTGADQTGPSGLSESGRSCLPDDRFDLAGWTGTGDYATELGAARLALTNELDRTAPGAVEHLARIEIAFGFGREARQILALDGGQSRERDLLRLLAALVEGEAVPAAALNDQAGCAGAGALWRALARGSLDGTGEVERTAIEAAWRLLPPSVRAAIGLRLAPIFSAAGDSLGAADLIDHAVTSMAQPPAAADLARAEVALAADEPRSALAHLETLAREDPDLSPATAISMVDLALAQGRMPTGDTLDLLRALRFEYRGRAEEADLAATETRLLAALGRYAEALANAATLPDLRQGAALSQVLAELTDHGDDAAFLDIAFQPLRADLTPETVNLAAARLIALGFPDRALDLLNPTTAGAALAERRYLRAEAAAALGRTDQVEAELIGLSDPRAEALRATAGLLRLSGDSAVDDDAAWTSGDWTALETSADPLLRDAAVAMETAPAGLPDTTPLAARSALLAEAERTRTLAQDLLTRFAAP